MAKTGFDWRSRRFRLALLLGAAVLVAVYAWRTSQPQRPPCEAGREEVRDAAGKVTAIRRKDCIAH